MSTLKASKLAKQQRRRPQAGWTRIGTPSAEMTSNCHVEVIKREEEGNSHRKVEKSVSQKGIWDNWKGEDGGDSFIVVGIGEILKREGAGGQLWGLRKWTGGSDRS